MIFIFIPPILIFPEQQKRYRKSISSSRFIKEIRFTGISVKLSFFILTVVNYLVKVREISRKTFLPSIAMKQIAKDLHVEMSSSSYIVSCYREYETENKTKQNLASQLNPS